MTQTVKENPDVGTTIRGVNSVSGEKLHDLEIICLARGCVSIPAPPLHTGLVSFSIWLLHRYAWTHSHIWIHKYITSSPKGNDRSPESNVPRSNVVFSAIKANHSKVNSPETLFSPVKYKSQWSTFILRSNVRSYWTIIPNCHVHSSNNLQDIRHNHWTVKYRSQWSTFILRSNARSYWTIIPNCHVHTSNSLQDIRQNLWTLKYRSQWSIFILRSYWTIIPNYHVHTSNSLQDIRQNHWTVKYRSCWPSLHDPQVNVTRLSHVWQTVWIRFVEMHILKLS